jgi:hypothetical protein
MSQTRKGDLGKQEMGKAAFNESGAPARFAELATFTRPWEAWLVRDALVDRGIEAWVDDAGMDNPYRTATGVERVYVSVDDLLRAREVVAAAEREPTAERPVTELKVPSWRVIAVGGLVGAVLIAILPHGVRLVAFMVLIAMALPWPLLIKGHAGPAPHRRDDRESGDDPQRGEGP